MPLEIVTFAEQLAPPPLRAQVLALHDEAWPRADPREAQAGHDPALRPVSMLLVRDGAVLAALDILSKQIEHAGERYAASGLSTVVTARVEQGKGYGGMLVRAAREAIAAGGADLAIFTCDTPLGPFYERAGWQLIESAVLVGGTPAKPFPSDRFDKVTLAAFFSPRAQANAAAFRNARIALHPGTIDKLW